MPGDTAPAPRPDGTPTPGVGMVRVVGIGASAGGLEALEQLLARVLAASG